jgi:hypothetical protein
VALAHRKHNNNNNNTKKQETEKAAAGADAGECGRGRACRDVCVFSVLEGGRWRRGGLEIPHNIILLLFLSTSTLNRTSWPISGEINLTDKRPFWWFGFV